MSLKRESRARPKDRSLNEAENSATLSRILLGAVLIVVAGLIVYANSFQGEFVFDDKEAIKENPTIRQLWPLKDVLFPARHVNTVDGRPLLNLSFALNYAAHGLDVWGYHAVNLAIHLLAGLVLFGIVRRTMLLPPHRERLGRVATWLALIVALIWTVHPLQTESVTGICQRAESLVGLFYLLTFYFAIRGFDSARHLVWQIASVATCALGMAAKEVMATAPVLILLYDWLFLAGSREALRARWGFYLALFATWGVLAALLVSNAGWGMSSLQTLIGQWSGQGQSTAAGTSESWVNYALTQFSAIALYLRLSFWPKPLVLDYGVEVAKNFREVALPALVGGLLLVGTILAFRRHRWIGFAGAWFFLILAPSSSIVPLPGQTIAEHRMYLSLAAVVVVLVVGGYLGWCRLLPHVVRHENRHDFLARTVPFAASIAVLLTLGGLTLARNADYRTEYSIMLDTVRKRPTNSRAHNNLGFALAERGEFDQAVYHYERALGLDPDNADAHNNLGTQLMTREKLEEAIRHFERALQIRPDYAYAHNNLGGALAKQGKLSEATQHFGRAIQLQPDNAIALCNLGNALMSQGDLREAVQNYERAIQLNPSYAEAHTNLGEALTRQGRIDEAIQHFQQAANLAVTQGKSALAEAIAQWITYCRSATPPQSP